MVITTIHLLKSMDWNLQNQSCAFVIETWIYMTEIKTDSLFNSGEVPSFLTWLTEDRVVQTPECLYTVRNSQVHFTVTEDIWVVQVKIPIYVI